MASQEELTILVRLKDFATKEFKSLGNTVSSFGHGIGHAFHLFHTALNSVEGVLGLIGVHHVFHEIVEMTKHVIEGAEKLDILSERLGISTEALSVLSFASRRVGLDIGDLEKGLKIASKNLAEFSVNGGGPAAQTLNLLGDAWVRAARGGAKLEDLLPEISRSFKGLDESSRILLASDLFGKSGTSLIPLFTSNMEEAAEKTEEFGLKLNKVQTKDAHEFVDAIKDMKDAFIGFSTQAILPLLPQLTELTHKFTESILSIKDTSKDAIDFIATLFDNLQNNFSKLDKLGLAGPGSFAFFGSKAKAYRDALLEMSDAIQLSINKQHGFHSETLNAVIPSLEHASRTVHDLGNEFEEIGPKLEDATGNYGPTLEQAGHYADEVRTKFRHLSSEADEYYHKRLTAFLETNRQQDREIQGLLGAKQAILELGKASEEWGKAFHDAIIDINNALANDTTAAFLDVIDGTKNAKEAFHDFARSVLKDLARVIVQTLILKVVQGGIGAIGDTISSGGTSTITTSHAAGPQKLNAAGNVINRRIAFRYGGGLTGIAGEAGPEAIMPLARDSSGRLGVRGGGGQVFNISVTVQQPAGGGNFEQAKKFGQQVIEAVTAGLQTNAAFKGAVRAA